MERADRVSITTTNRLSLPDALRASEARFRTIIERNADGIVVARRDGVIRYVNPAASRLLDRPAGELIGEHFGVPVVPGETTEIDIVGPGGSTRVAELRVVETEWEGEPALLASLRDITEHKRLQEQLEQKVRELAEVDRRKDEFLAMLAHELRNPLAPILNAVHVMRLQGNDQALREAMRDVVERQVRYMSRLVDDLLDVSRITRGKIQLRMEPVNLVSIIHRAVETTRPTFEARTHRLETALPTTPIRLLGDPIRLEQVLVNLLNNAAKYTEPGGEVALSAAIDGAETCVTVRDNGIGIAPSFLPRVFDLFTQADNSPARSYGGLGIGLTLVQSLVQIHGGTIEAHSDGLGLGSTFRLRLPLAMSAVPLPAPKREPQASESAPGPRRSRRVLIVDDNVPSADSLALIIKLWGHDARVANTGTEALETAAAYRPEITLLDIGLPGMDGYEVARHIRESTELSSIMLIAMTGYGRDEDRKRAREAGFDHHLVKPIDLDLLEQMLG
jgi:signal transduction histidine kinase